MGLMILVIGILTFFKCAVQALLEEQFISFEAGKNSLDISSATIIADSHDFVGVHIALKSLVYDFEQITGRRPSLQNITANITTTGRPNLQRSQSSDVHVFIGSLNSSLIHGLSSQGFLDVSDLEGKWETFKTLIIDETILGTNKAFVIVGSDKRGTIFGIHTLAEQSGQSPYHWFADVPAKKHSAIYALPKTTVHGPPTVKYRGLFINDEEPALTTWWAQRHNTSYYPLDTEFYAYVFDLMLRLKANYMWPAMWASSTPPPGNIFFTDDPGNMQLADDYGIVISTSHHEPMQRATNEWNATETGPWDWRLNKQNVTRFMEDGIRRMRSNESYVTLGMRGPSDSAIVGDDAIEILKEVFEVERDIFRDILGDRKVNQVWTIYKEVATYYAAGLNPPDDVTIIMPDDNHGQIQRLPTGSESKRDGGIGVYYHFEYFGSPRSYKWSNSNSLPKVLKELLHAFWRDATRIWVINVGDIKPMELPLSFAMDLAWNASLFNFEMIPTYLESYAAREFGQKYAKGISMLLMEFNHLIGMRRFEMVHPGTYSVLNYHEAERVLARWTKLADRAKELYEEIPEDYKPAYYELVFYPLVSGATYYAVNIGSAFNQQYAMERRNSANLLAQQVLKDFDYDFDLIEEFDTLLQGKWKHIMSQAKLDAVTQQPRNWANPSRDTATNISFVQLRQNMQFSLGNLGIYAEESTSPINQGRWAESIDLSMPTIGYPATLPVMTPYGPSFRTVDLFMRGDYRIPIEWELENVNVDWLSITPRSGKLNESKYDERLTVGVNWDMVPKLFNGTINVGVISKPAPYPYFDIIRILILNQRAPFDFRGFPETTGYISIEAPHFQRLSSLPLNSTLKETVGFHKIPHLGSRTASGSIALRPYNESRSSLPASTSAYAEYNIYLFNRTSALNATVYINACLDTDPNLLMRFSLTLDDAPQSFTRVLGDPKNAGDVPPEWISDVPNQVWTKTVRLGAVDAGQHSLRWSVNSPEIYLEKIVLNTQGGLRESYLGPPETILV